MIVPVAAAGASDIVARIMADAMTPLLGRPIVVENIAGAGSTLGANAFQQAPADGQTIYVPTNNHALMKLIYPQFAYDPAADFVAVALVSRQPFVLAVHPSLPTHSVPELIAWLRERGTAANLGAAAQGAAALRPWARPPPRRGRGAAAGGDRAVDADRRAPEPQTRLKESLNVGEQIEKLAQFIARTGWDDMPGAVHRRAKLVLLDTIGVTLAGAARPEVIGLRERLLLGAGRGATVLAAGLPQADIRTAALLNGIAARSVELCEGANGLQPSPHILPGGLAIAEQRGLGGRAMLGAFVLGYEVAGRLNRVYTQRALSHPNAQLSLLGAAAAGARLQELDGAGISLAMRVATSMLMTPSYNNTLAGGTTLNLPAGLGALAATPGAAIP